MVLKPKDYDLKGVIGTGRPRMSSGVIRITNSTIYHPSAKSLATPKDREKPYAKRQPEQKAQNYKIEGYTKEVLADGTIVYRQPKERYWSFKDTGEVKGYGQYSPREVRVSPSGKVVVRKYNIGTSDRYGWVHYRGPYLREERKFTGGDYSRNTASTGANRKEVVSPRISCTDTKSMKMVS